MRSANVAVVLVSALGLSAAVKAEFFGRDNGRMYYDDVLGITWLTDAGYAGTTGYGLPGNDPGWVDGEHAYDNGRMTWGEAMCWAARLNIDGITGWRLPTGSDAGSEMYRLFHEQSITALNPGPFANLRAEGYWSDTPVCVPYMGSQIYIPVYVDFGSGVQSTTMTYSMGNAWAVINGDVPEPSALLLLCAGVAALSLRRRG